MSTEAVIDIYVSLLWPLFAILVGYALLVILFSYFEISIKNFFISRTFDAGSKWRTDQKLVAWFNGLSPTDFEIQVTEMFKRLGYRAIHNGKVNDKGVDILLEKDGRKTVVQCKHYSNKVGSPAIREFYGTIASQLADDGLFVTNNFFTVEARKEAEGKPIELVDGKKLVTYMKQAKMGFVVDSTCPECGSDLTEKNGKYGKFIGCSSYPKCTYTRSSN